MQTLVRPMRVIVTDDHPLIVDAIVGVLREAGHTVVGACNNSRELLHRIGAERVDVITLDIGMPGLNGIDTARQVRVSHPRVKIIFVTQQTDAVYVRSAFQAGASAFVAKQSSSKELVVALEAIAAGRHYVTPGLIDMQGGMDVALEAMRRRKGQGLTQRQREVLQLVAEGKTAKEIATALNISTKTVEFHKQSLMSGLNLRTTAELTRYAISQGLIFL